jgi:translation initiation factor IF-2
VSGRIDRRDPQTTSDPSNWPTRSQTLDNQTPSKFTGWIDRSRVEQFKKREQNQGIGRWGDFSDEPAKSRGDLATSSPATAPLSLAEKTDGILSRHRRRQGRFDDEGQAKKKILKARNSRRDQKEDEDDDRSYKMDKEQYMIAKEARKKKIAEETRKAKEEAAQRRFQIKLPPYISNANLAKALNVRFEQFTQQLERLGFKDLSHDYVLSSEDAGLVAMEYGFEPVMETTAQNIVPAAWPTEAAKLLARPPVVTIMGHVDHGKTTILDFLRKSSIAAGEFGGITQHIGAFSVPLSSGKTITFLDTPGHAAFLSMRQRGATVTDIVVLVVAADDGVMPQTLEAIRHAKSAKVPVIVAVNKVDKPEANIERVKQDLSRHDVDIEDYGGDVQVVPVSGKTGQGMSDLEDSIITLSEILDHRAPTDGNVEGWVLEASTKPHGRVATVLIRRGLMKPGDIFVSGTQWSRVKTLRNEFGTQVESAGPGSAVEIDGWRDLPSPGDEVLQAIDERHAAAVVRTREDLADGVKLAQDMEAINDVRRAQREDAPATPEVVGRQRRKRHNVGVALDESALKDRKIDGTFRETKRDNGIEEAFFVVKGDVEGSVEAVVDLIAGLGNGHVRANVIRAGAGAVNETDVELAYAADGVILAFNAEIDADIRARADRAGVQIIEQRVIYRVAEDVNAILSDMLPEIVSQRVTGEAEVLQSFSIKVATKISSTRQLTVAGCRVRNGLITRGSRVRVLRSGDTVYDGHVETLKNVKKDVSEMKKDTECGMSFSDGWEGFQSGDQIQCYSETREKASLE